jgi:hypothetical protein
MTHGLDGIFWRGVIGPDLGATDETTAAKRCDGRRGGFSVVVG